MSEFMYSVLVPGGRRKDSCKEIAVSKVSVFVQTGWGLGLKRLTTNLQKFYKILLRQSSKAQTQSSGWDLTRRRLRLARRASTRTTTTTNFIENWKITDYITFPPANFRAEKRNEHAWTFLPRSPGRVLKNGGISNILLPKNKMFPLIT